MKKDININVNNQSILKRLFPWIVVVGLIIAIFLMNTCEGNSSSQPREDTIKRDTVYVTKTIPGDTITVIQTKFVPVGEEENVELKEEIKKLKNDKERLEYLLAELSVKAYDTTYTFERGKLRLIDTVQGSLLGRKFDLTLFPIEYQERIITNTITKYPKFAVTGGLGVGIETDFKYTFEEPYVGAYLGFRNRKGLHLEFGYTTRYQFQIKFAKDLFVFY